MADTQHPSPTSPAPSVGRIVHYHDYNQSQPIPGIVTAVHEDGTTVNLTLFPDLQDIEPAAEVSWSEKPKDDHWSWPPWV